MQTYYELNVEFERPIWPLGVPVYAYIEYNFHKNAQSLLAVCTSLSTWLYEMSVVNKRISVRGVPIP